MLTGWFKCPVVAWKVVRCVLPKPWSYDCIVADVRWWNDQIEMGWQASLPSHEDLSTQWGISLDEVYQICDEVTGEGKRKTPRARASRGLSDQTTDQTTYTKSDSGTSGSGAREPAAGTCEPDPDPDPDPEPDSTSPEGVVAVYAKFGLGPPPLEAIYAEFGLEPPSKD